MMESELLHLSAIRKNLSAVREDDSDDTVLQDPSRLSMHEIAVCDRCRDSALRE